MGRSEEAGIMRYLSFLGVSTLLVACLVSTIGIARAQTASSEFTNAIRYDGDRRVTGVIAADPDGSDSLRFAAVRNTYDGAGRLIRVEKGELASWQSEAVAPANWAGFTIFSKAETAYDGADHKILETVWGWDTVNSAWLESAATQYSYDANERLECTAVRMNPAAFASLPASACNLGTAGSFDDDRITRNVYGDVGELLKVRKAYGTSLQQDYVTYAYSANNKPISMIDANGNKASMTYDGFDRQVRWNFPSKTVPSQVSTDDYEEYGYDANDNRTSLRKRDARTLTFTYDALNRMTSKVVPDACVLS